jgi:CRISPR-associated endonuclease Cas1
MTGQSGAPPSRTATSERRRARYATTKKVDRPASPLWTKAQVAKSDDLGIHIATGYGIRIAVERGHLIVEDGLADERRRIRFNRATSRLKRLVVIGHSGSVSLDALRWITDAGAVFVQIDHDANLVTMSAPARHHDPALRRAQALAADSETGRQIMVNLLTVKLDRQARLCDRIEQVTGMTGQSEIIRSEKDKLVGIGTTKELRHREATAAQAYWRAWARVPVTFSTSNSTGIPEHWRVAGPRTSRLDGQWPRRAVSPIHAMLNYLYAILEVEATIACHSLGLDPSIGILHADARYRHSMAADLMEPVRPVVDGVVLDTSLAEALRSDSYAETGDGTCRLLSPLTQRLSAQAAALSTTTLSHARRLVEILRNRATGPTAPAPVCRPEPETQRPNINHNVVEDRKAWESAVLPRLRALSAGVIAERTGISLTSVKEARSGRVFPRRSNRRLLASLVIDVPAPKISMPIEEGLLP